MQVPESVARDPDVPFPIRLTGEPLRSHPRRAHRAGPRAAPWIVFTGGMK